METFLYDKLVTIQHAYQHTLAPVSTDPPIPPFPLYPHQIRLVQAMKEHRERLLRGVMIGDEAIQGKLGILGDAAGSGKSRSILAYLARSLPPPASVCMELAPHSGPHFFSHTLRHPNHERSAHLIIVPDTLFEQWKDEIENHAHLPFVGIPTRGALKGDVMARILQHRLVLTTNRCYPHLQAFVQLHQIEWDNLVMDEATSIFIPASAPPLQFQFLWLITNQWIPLLMKNAQFSKRSLFALRDRITLHPDLEEWLQEEPVQPYDEPLVSASFLKDYLPFFHSRKGLLLLRTSNEHLRASMALPAPTQTTLACKPSLTLNSLTSFYLARNRELHLRTEQIPALFQALGISCTTPSEYALRQPEEKRALMERKVKEKECSICMEECSYATIVDCCYHVYCGTCILKNMVLHARCPTCRKVLSLSHMECLEPWEPIQRSRTKWETVLDIVQRHPEGVLMIYSPFTQLYYEGLESLASIEQKAEKIEGHLVSLRKTIRNVQEGKTRIVFVSDTDVLRGLSLSCITHLIFYHEPASYEMQQRLIHLAQRLGRTHPLTIIHLNSEIPV